MKKNLKFLIMYNFSYIHWNLIYFYSLEQFEKKIQRFWREGTFYIWKKYTMY